VVGWSPRLGGPRPIRDAEGKVPLLVHLSVERLILEDGRGGGFEEDARPALFDNLITCRRAFGATGSAVPALGRTEPALPGFSACCSAACWPPGEPDTLPFMHYDVEVPGSLGVFARRYWCPVDAPVIGADGRIALIAECVEEISDKVQRFVGGLAADAVHEEPG
jgi:hypothetical protein